MSFLKYLDDVVKKAEGEYSKVKDETKTIRRKVGEVSDYIIPPPKKLKGRKKSRSK